MLWGEQCLEVQGYAKITPPLSIHTSRIGRPMRTREEIITDITSCEEDIRWLERVRSLGAPYPHHWTLDDLERRFRDRFLHKLEVEQELNELEGNLFSVG
jgi:hypothetical protein